MSQNSTFFMNMSIDLDFFASGTICCIAADKESTKSFYFFYVEDVDCTAECDMFDDYNHKIVAGQSYLAGHFLEEVTNKTQKGGYLYYINQKRTAFIFKESIIYPFVQFEEGNKNKKLGHLFLMSENYCDILYFVEETKMAALV